MRFASSFFISHNEGQYYLSSPILFSFQMNLKNNPTGNVSATV